MSPDENAASIALMVAVDPAHPEYGDQIQAGLRLDNRGSEPLVVLQARLMSGRANELVEGPIETLPATLSAGGGANLHGELRAGGEAGAREWHWSGEAEVHFVPILDPGNSLAVHGPLVADETLGGRLRGVVRAVPLDARVPLLSIASARVEEGGPTRAHLRLSRPATAGTRAAALPERRPLGPYALLAADYQRLVAETTEIGRALSLDLGPRRPALSEARKQAALAGGPAAWSAEADAWALEARGETWLVNPTGIRKIRGRLVQVMAWLERNPTCPLTLHALHAEADPGGLVSFLRARGHAVEVIVYRGGHRITVTAQAGALLKLVADLAERGLVLDGHSARRG